MSNYCDKNIYNDTIFVFALVFLIFYCYRRYRNNDYDSFISRPNYNESIKYTRQILDNKQVFGENFYAAKNKMHWIDAITYEDIKKLIRENKFDENSIISILN